jgi:hypothetical protein
MSDNEERRVKARHEVTQYYQRRSFQRTTSRQNLPRRDMTVSNVPNPGSSNSSSDDDVEDDTYMPSPRAYPHGKGKSLASTSGSGAARDEEIEEEVEGDDGDGGEEVEKEEEGEGETFDVEEITPTSYVDMGNPVFRQPLNPDWRKKVSYKGKTDLVREKMKENLRLIEKEAGLDYRFHMVFQQDFYESVIIPEHKPVALSQWIDWNYMEGKSNSVFDEVVTAYRTKHLRDIMAFKKNWNNEIIAQFFATLYVEERGDTHKNSIG